jgi:hypothetical protein
MSPVYTLRTSWHGSLPVLRLTIEVLVARQRFYIGTEPKISKARSVYIVKVTCAVPKIIGTRATI